MFARSTPPSGVPPRSLTPSATPRWRRRVPSSTHEAWRLLIVSPSPSRKAAVCLKVLLGGDLLHAVSASEQGVEGFSMAPTNCVHDGSGWYRVAATHVRGGESERLLVAKRGQDCTSTRDGNGEIYVSAPMAAEPRGLRITQRMTIMCAGRRTRDAAGLPIESCWGVFPGYTMNADGTNHARARTHRATIRTTDWKRVLSRAVSHLPPEEGRRQTTLASPRFPAESDTSSRGPFAAPAHGVHVNSETHQGLRGRRVARRLPLPRIPPGGRAFPHCANDGVPLNR